MIIDFFYAAVNHCEYEYMMIYVHLSTGLKGEFQCF